MAEADALQMSHRNQPEASEPGGEPGGEMERRLATIMMADVAGYSRMMGENEERTVQMLRGHRQVFDSLIKTHRGRIFNTAGDAILAEFPSAVEAVRCATEIQSALRTRNEHYPPEQHMWFRIGINLGDVIIQGSDLLGDGVNVAARIQTIAKPGGVCISGSVYDQIQNKLTLRFNQLGERTFKNIARPVRTFAVSEADGDPFSSLAVAGRLPRGRKLALGGGLLFLLAAVGLGLWLFQRPAVSTDGQLMAVVEAELRVVEEELLVIERERRLAEEQRAVVEAEIQKAVREREAAEAARSKAREAWLEAEAAQQQARLEAEVQVAKVALERAAMEEARRRADEARKAEESARIQAKLEAEATAAREAMERAEQERERLDRELRRVEAEKEAAAAAVALVVAHPPGADGTYSGKLCNQRAGAEPECWPVALQIRDGLISGSWQTKAGQQATVKGTLAADGMVSLTLNTWRPDGQPVTAQLQGQRTAGAVRASGKWPNGMSVGGEWTRN